MTQIIYLIQADNGPIKLGQANDTTLTRKLATLQAGNALELHLRHALHDKMIGDQAQLHTRIQQAAVDLLIRDDWYQPEILDRIPTDVDDQVRRAAAAKQLADLADLGRRNAQA